MAPSAFSAVASAVPGLPNAAHLPHHNAALFRRTVFCLASIRRRASAIWKFA
jgi:hypothetical protein